MKKVFILLLIVSAALLSLVACGDKAPVEPELPPEVCSHEWALSSFVTGESDIPFAGVFKCKKCEESETRSFDYTDVDLPLVNITGDISEISKENAVPIKVTYADEALSFATEATAKYQGRSSLKWEKHNFSVTFREDGSTKKKKVLVREEWGAQSKYCLKANYTDPIGLRNVVLSDLYGEISHTREVEDPFSDLVNGGAVDGYSVLLYINGQYQGLYNWNTPKDKWIFGMGSKTEPEAVLCGTSYLFDRNGIEIDEEDWRYWDFEYYNEDYADGSYDWAVDSFNEMFRFVKNSDTATIRARASEYLNLDRTLDVLLFSCVFGTRDNIYNNLIFCTYDGVHWAPVPYDMDRSLGRDGAELNVHDGFATFDKQPMYLNLFVAFFDELKARYFELRETLLTRAHVMSLVTPLTKGLDDKLFAAEREKWPSAEWRSTSPLWELRSYEQEVDFIARYLDGRFDFCDEVFSTAELTFAENGSLDWGEENNFPGKRME